MLVAEHQSPTLFETTMMAAGTNNTWNRSTIDEDDALLKEVDFSGLSKSFRDGVRVADRTYRLRKYRQCFIGLEAVDFIAMNQKVPRDVAVQFGNILMKQGVFRHVANNHGFQDGYLFYTFVKAELK